ncbi:Hypoxic response protein 1 [Thiorhodovibrio winogradskyi]|uniref:Hypoxic response protein 1 n=1 Tax=Thiorhodovibrio winogradskyi TaxID=77007 RepID=A0ABZ0S7H4_9GAMM|nr:CBS domain-containing protein [Thiorhodovibrio winogradskyi]
MQVQDVMTPNFRVIPYTASMGEAATLMRDEDVGFLPVTNENQVVGILTDRDITVRGLAAGFPPETAVSEVMSPGVDFQYADADPQAAAQLMEERQVRRLVVLDQSNRCVGVVSLGDISVGSGNPVLGGATLERISEDSPASSVSGEPNPAA